MKFGSIEVRAGGEKMPNRGDGEAKLWKPAVSLTLDQASGTPALPAGGFFEYRPAEGKPTVLYGASSGRARAMSSAGS